jgi:hypothetical protein
MVREDVPMLNCGIPIVDGISAGMEFDEHVMTGTDMIVLYDLGRLSVFLTYPGRSAYGSEIIHSERRVKALAFHGENNGGRWVWASRPDILVEEIIGEVEKEQAIDALLVCNPTREDIRRNDLIYIVGNELAPTILNSRGYSASDIDLGVFPNKVGFGYFSIRGEKVKIPSQGNGLMNSY